MPTTSAPPSKTDALLRRAIKRKRLVQLRYDNEIRILEPHDYGIRKGSVKLLGFQIQNFSTKSSRGWRLLKADLISELHFLNRTFPGGRPTPSGIHHTWDELFARVEPAENSRDKHVHKARRLSHSAQKTSQPSEDPFAQKRPAHLRTDED